MTATILLGLALVAFAVGLPAGVNAWKRKHRKPRATRRPRRKPCPCGHQFRNHDRNGCLDADCECNAPGRVVGDVVAIPKKETA